jgi:hypothetical protein
MRKKTKENLATGFAILYIALIPVVIVIACLSIKHYL